MGGAERGTVSVTKQHRPGGFNHRHLVSCSSGGRSPSSSGRWSWFPLRPPPWACGRLATRPSVHVCVLTSSSKDTSAIGIGRTLLTFQTQPHFEALRVKMSPCEFGGHRLRGLGRALPLLGFSFLITNIKGQTVSLSPHGFKAL